MKRSELLVAAAAVVLYAPTWGHFFVSDDFLNLERSMFRTVAEGLALFSVRDVDFYRPLARLHFGVMVGLFSDRVLLWNLANTLLHAAASVLAARLAGSLLGRGRERAATATGLLFAVHFLHVEPVVWASGVATLLVTAFTFLALLAFRRARETGRVRSRVLAVVAFAAALMSQETAVAFVPLLFLTTWIWPVGEGRPARRVPGWLELAPYAVLLAAYAAVATSIDRGGAASPYRMAAGAHVVKNVVFFAVGGFVPIRYWEVQDLWAASRDSGGLASFLGALAVRPHLSLPLAAAAVAWPWALWRGGRDVRGGLAWVGAAALPFLPLPGSGERFQYLPSFGACLVLGIAAHWLLRAARSPGARRGAVAVCALGGLVIVTGVVDRQADWRLAGRWSRALVDRWGYFRLFDPAAPVELWDVPDHWRSAWVFRNGFPSMVRLYWEGRPYWRVEERPAEAPPAYRVRAVAARDGTLGIVPVRGAEGGADRPRLRHESPPSSPEPAARPDSAGDGPRR